MSSSKRSKSFKKQAPPPPKIEEAAVLEPPQIEILRKHGFCGHDIFNSFK
jgi:hypothetical protein